MDVTTAITVSIPGLERYQKSIQAQLKGGDGRVRSAFHQWAVRYRSFVQQRFNKFSRGGGDWPPLAESTLRRRHGNRPKPRKPRKLKKVEIVHNKHGRSWLKVEYHKRKKRVKTPLEKLKKASILRDTGSLFNALAPTLSAPPGSVNIDLPDGIEVGYGGSAGYPGGGVTIAELAYWHQTGAGYLPVRQIIVPPDPATIAAMVRDMQRACDEESV